MISLILSLFSLLLTFNSEVKITPQSPDLIWYDGVLYPLHEQPMHQFHSNWEVLRKEIDDKEFYLNSGSSCWQGFIAEWELTKEGELFLRNLFDCDSREYYFEIGENGIICLTGNPFVNLADLKNIFGEKVTENGVKATWFSGYLVIPKGEAESSYYGGYKHLYKDYHKIAVCDGNVILNSNTLQQ
jgi:hypothetical protein